MAAYFDYDDNLWQLAKSYVDLRGHHTFTVWLARSPTVINCMCP